MEIDGTDYTEGTTGLQLTLRDDGPPVLALWRTADAVAVEGAAVVEVATEGHGFAEAAQAIREMDASELERQALNGMGLGGGSVAAKVLQLAADALEQA